MDRALGRNAEIAVQSADQQLADLAGTPMGLVALGRDDQALDLPRQLVGVANLVAIAVLLRPGDFLISRRFNTTGFRPTGNERAA